MKKHTLILQSPPTDVTGRGQPDGDWTNDGTFYCSVEQLRGRELTAAGQLYGQATLEVKTYRNSAAPITIKKRWLFGSRVLSIGFVDDQEGFSKEVTCLCSEVS